MKEFERPYYAFEYLEDGITKHYTSEITKVERYGIDLYDENHLVFSFCGKTSAPIPVVYDREWAWKPEKSRIKSSKPAEKLFVDLSMDFWSCYTYAMAKQYCQAKV